MLATLPPPAPPSLAIKNCAYCGDRSLATGAKCLTGKDGVPVCSHKFCLTCRDKLEPRMQGVFSSGSGCPECFKAFAKIIDVVLPTENAQDFFKSVNIGKGGQITKEELADWLSSYFFIGGAEAMRIVSDNWGHWDTETRGKAKQYLLMMAAKDGNLDEKEFEVVRQYLAEMVSNARLGLATPASSAPGARVKRPSDDDGLTSAAPPPARRQRTETAQDLQARMTTVGLLSKLKEGDGSSWFQFFDTDGSGKLSKEEVINAMVKTLVEHKIAEDDARSVVGGIWSIIDTDGSQEIEQGSEFNTLREMLIESTKPRD